MVWKPKKSRRGDCRGTIPSAENGSGPRQLRSCLKVGPDEKIFVQCKQSESTIGQDSTCNPRDNSIRSSSRSILGMMSASVSSWSRDTPPPEENVRCNGSITSADSAISARNSTDKIPQQNSVVSRVSAESRTVKFGSILIREHERAVGDNPSCSTGPPIGIGWRHGDTKVMLLDDYEGKRNHRRKLIVLTRAEREELLLNWGIAFDDIIDSIRANIRVKNQRRQTVTNLGKVERLEEAFESATRKIKRALLLRRRTGEKVKQLQQQADVAAKNVHSPPSSVSDEQQGSDTIRSDESTVKLTCTSDDKIEKSFLHDCRKVVTSEAMLVRAASSLSDIDDLHTSISGFSLDNSTTASFKDLEEFYRELELEMFGDMPLPNMVGETLEVPGLTIPEEERVYHVPQFYVGYTEAPSVTPSYAEILDESKEYHESDFPPHPSHLTQHPEMKMYFQPNPLSSASSAGQNQNKPARSILRHILEQTDEQEQDTSSGCPIESEHESQFLPTPSRQHGYILYDDPIMAIRMAQAPLPQFKLSSSLDSADLKQVEKHRANIARAYLSQAVTAMEQRYLHPSLAPPIPPTNEFGINFYPVKQRQESPPKQFQFPTHHEETCSGHSEKSCRRGSNSRRSRHREDEPLVCHIPLYTKRSLTDWMEGYDNCDFSNIHFPSHEIVTITEDMGCNDRIRPAIPYVMASGPPVYLAPPRFPQTLL